MPRRKTRLPGRYRDLLLVAPPIIEPQPEPPRTPTPSPVAISIPPTKPIQTNPNSFGVYRVYEGALPTYDPDFNFSINQVADGPNFATTSQSNNLEGLLPFSNSNVANSKQHFDNQSIFRLMSWHYNASNTKSFDDLNALVHNVLLADDFKTEDLIGFNAAKEAKKIYDIKATTASAPNGWIEGSVLIRLPCDGSLYSSEDDAPVYVINGLLYRKPLEIIKAAYQENRAIEYHNTPFKEYWKPSSDSPRERIYSELYNSDCFLQEHAKLPKDTSDGIESVIAALMIWSDATQLGSFGNTSLWPMYLFFGNQSKYTRAKPSEFAAHHLAYVPKVRFSLYSPLLYIYEFIA